MNNEGYLERYVRELAERMPGEAAVLNRIALALNKADEHHRQARDMTAKADDYKAALTALIFALLPEPQLNVVLRRATAMLESNGITLASDEAHQMEQIFDHLIKRG